MRDYFWKLEVIDSIQQTGGRAFGSASFYSPIYLFSIYNELFVKGNPATRPIANLSKICFALN